MPTIEDFLLEQVREQEISALTAVMARESLLRLRKGIPRFAEPSAAVGPDQEVGFSWDAGPHHLEVEFLDESVTLYWRDRNTSENYFLRQVPPEKLVEMVAVTGMFK